MITEITGNKRFIISHNLQAVVGAAVVVVVNLFLKASAIAMSWSKESVVVGAPATVVGVVNLFLNASSIAPNLSVVAPATVVVVVVVNLFLNASSIALNLSKKSVVVAPATVVAVVVVNLLLKASSIALSLSMKLVVVVAPATVVVVVVVNLLLNASSIALSLSMKLVVVAPATVVGVVNLSLNAVSMDASFCWKLAVVAPATVVGVVNLVLRALLRAVSPAASTERTDCSVWGMKALAGLTLTLMPRLCSRLAWSQCRSTEPPDSPANTGMPRPEHKWISTLLLILDIWCKIYPVFTWNDSCPTYTPSPPGAGEEGLRTEEVGVAEQRQEGGEHGLAQARGQRRGHG